MVRELRKRLPGVRDQGSRPTCLSFAVAVAHGLVRASSDGYLALSEEMAHWGASLIAGGADCGVTFEHMNAGVGKYGQCTLNLWPYDAKEPSGSPSSEAKVDAASKLAKLTPLSTSFHVVADLVSKDVPVILALPVCPGFYSTRDGRIPTPDEGEVIYDYHAVLATNVLIVPQLGDSIEFRNSWGEDWGDAGYGYICGDYLDKYALAAAIVETLEDTDFLLEGA